MRTALAWISMLVQMVGFGLIVAMFLKKKLRENWKAYLAIGICFAMLVVESLTSLIVFRKGDGALGGVWLVLYLFVMWSNFTTAKKLRALKKNVDK